MANFCLPKAQATEFLRRLKSGEVNPEKLAGMTSAERRAVFSEFMGEDIAKQVNALFESKLLLKNKKQGMVTWAKKVSGLSPATKTDLISRIGRMDERILNPENEAEFLNDLVDKKIGIDGVTLEETKAIFELSQKAIAARNAAEATGWQDEAARIAYGNAALDFQEYVHKINPLKTSLPLSILNLPRTLKTTLDLSAPLRQGMPVIAAHPVRWAKAYKDMFKYAVSKDSFREMQADIVSRPTYDLMVGGGLRISSLAKKISQREENYMSDLVGKVPGFAASERAYVGFLNKLRADLFDDLLATAEMRGEDISKGGDTVRELANVVNNFTGSGNLGKNDRYGGQVPWLNATFFSPRKISATLNMMNPANILNPKLSATARRAHLRNFIGLLASSGIILSLAALMGADIETDSNSADFGKVKIDGTRFDVTGGNSTYAVLLSRLLTGKTKSTTSGNVYELGTGHKPTTRADILLKFTRNKFSPVASTMANLLYGENSIGEDITPTSEAKNLLVPMIIDTALEQAVAGNDMLPIIILSELFGIGTQTY